MRVIKIVFCKSLSPAIRCIKQVFIHSDRRTITRTNGSVPKGLVHKDNTHHPVLQRAAAIASYLWQRSGYTITERTLEATLY